MVFEENNGGVDDAKALLHAKRWDIYVNEKEKIVKGGYSVEVVGIRGRPAATIGLASFRIGPKDHFFDI